MNAGGVSKACKSNVSFMTSVLELSGKRESNTLVTYLRDGDSPPKGGLKPDSHEGTQVILM